ncbi:baculoviral IAP repeat-containing protein, partial [Endozoicomonas sp. ONNA2]|uniref:baculoviral IAP repeat-containing protein n=1 Tax=Endozoicomonas sp. ONNA2 TaxID=2828741 RepID=UPI002148BE12
MDNLPASEPLRVTVGANRNPANNCDRSTTDGSTFQSYHVRPIDSSNNYLSSDQGSVVYLHFPNREHHPVAGFQGNQNQPSGTYQATIDGHAQTFTSLRALLQIQSFIDNFRERSREYLPGFDIPPENNEIKTLILENECVQQVFLLVNEIDLLHVTGSSERMHLTEQASGSDRSDAFHLPAPRSDRRRSVSHENHPFSGVDHTPQYYSCHVNGEDKTFDSIDGLLAEQPLLRNFRDNARLYNVVSDIPATDADLKNFVKKRQERIAAFLLINDIKKTVPTANAGCSANYVTAFDREPTAGIFNQRMASVAERRSSLVLHNARRDVEFLRHIPHMYRNTFNLSDAGFYLSLKEEKLFCFSCGGSIEEWLEEWRTSTLDEVHATLYPECSFLRENVGIGFIEGCQQRLTPEQQRRLARPLESHPHLYSLPVSDHQWQQELNARSAQETIFNLREDRTLVDGMTVHEIARENRQLTRRVQQHWGCRHQPGASSAIDSNVQGCLEDFHRRFLPDSALHHEMDRLHGKVNAAHDPNNQLKLSLLQILENLLTLPDDQWADTGAEIAGMIGAAYNRDCQDHTSEIIDQIKTRMAFINIKRELEVGPDAIEIFNLLKKLKLFFNESVLYKV